MRSISQTFKHAPKNISFFHIWFFYISLYCCLNSLISFLFGRQKGEFMKLKFERKVYLLLSQYLCHDVFHYICNIFRQIMNCRNVDPGLVTFISTSKILRWISNLFFIDVEKKTPWMSVTKCSMHVVRNSITRRPPTVFVHVFSVMERKWRTKSKYTKKIYMYMVFKWSQLLLQLHINHKCMCVSVYACDINREIWSKNDGSEKLTATCTTAII